MSKSGTVKFFNEVKGFGFIEQDDGGEDLFAHRNNLGDGNNLVEGDKVTYDEQMDQQKGKLLAVDIRGGTGGQGGGKSGGKGFGGFDGGKGGGKGFGGKGGFDGGKGYGGGGKGFDDGKGKGKGKGKKPQPNTVFVGGLSWATTTDMLSEHFQECGEIIYAGVMTDRDTGRSRGFGKIEFGSYDEMQYAVQNYNQTQLDGRDINVREFS